MIRSRSKAGALIGSLVVALSACKGGQPDDILRAQSEQQQALAALVTQLEARVQALEKRPRLDFTLLHTSFAINEKMFEPILESSAQLEVKGENMPPTFYVDVMLKVEVPELQFEAIERQIFPVVDGRSSLQMQQMLPQHQLKPSQLHVTMKPVTWYRGQIINDDMVTYQ